MRILILLFSAVISWTVSAQTISFGKQGEKATATPLTTLTSNEGEDKNAFLLRVGRFLTNFTQKNAEEGCASICRTPQSSRWGVVVHTSQSVLACMVVTACPEGMESTNVSIHSHPDIGVYRLTRTDKSFLRARGDSKAQEVFRMRSYSGFSDIDKSNGEGYLVENGRLMFFDGTHVQDLGVVSASVFTSSL